MLAAVSWSVSLTKPESAQDLEIPNISENTLSAGWKQALPGQQQETRMLGDEWVRSGKSVVLKVPSVVVDEQNFVLNPAHPDFRRIAFLIPKPFDFDSRFFQ